MRKKVIPLLLSFFLLVGCTAEQVAALPPEPSVTPSQAVTPIAAKDFTLPAFIDQSFHPISGAGATNATLAPLMYEGLFALNTDLSATPVLCADYSVDETYTQWRFSLIEANFSDGTPLTAELVVSSLLLSQSAGSTYAARLEGAKFYASEGLVCIDLASPRSGLPALLDIPIVSGSGDRPSGTGPYALVERGTGWCLSLRPDWHGSESFPLSVIPLQPLAEYDDLVSAFDAGNISLVDTDLTAANALGFSGGYETVDYLTTQMVYLGFNLTSGACKDVNLRQAIAQLLDREALCQSELARHATATALPVAPHSVFYPRSVEPNWSQADPSALLEAAGYPLNEEGLRVQGRNPLTLNVLVCNENSYMMNLAKTISTELEHLGFSVVLQSVSYHDYISQLSLKAFDLYLGQVRLTADGDLTGLVSGALNYSDYQSGEARERLNYYHSAPEELREGALAALCEVLLEDVPFTAIGFKHRSVLSPWGEISGLAPVQSNVFYRFSAWKFS